jgi:hypothetical protein
MCDHVRLRFGQATRLRMQAQQLLLGKRGRSQYLAGDRSNEVASDERSSKDSKVLRFNGDKSPAACCARPLMHALAARVQDDVARLQPHPAPYGGWIMMRRKRYKDPLRCQGDIGNAREVFLAVEQVQMAQLDPSQVRPEFFKAGKDNIDPRTANIRLVVGGI